MTAPLSPLVPAPLDLLDALDKIEGQAVCGCIAKDLEEAQWMLAQIAMMARSAIESLASVGPSEGPRLAESPKIDSNKGVTDGI